MGRIFRFFLKTKRHSYNRGRSVFVTLCCALLGSLLTSGCGPGVDLVRPRPSFFNSEPKAPQYQLIFLKAPSAGIAGTPWDSQPGVGVQDAAGQRVTSLEGPVTLSIIEGPSDGVISGTTTVQISDGVASFTGLSIQRAGTYRLKASAPGALEAETYNLVIQPGPLQKIRIETNPSPTATAGVSLATAPKVSLRDANDNLVTDPNPTFSISAFTDSECRDSAPLTPNGNTPLVRGEITVNQGIVQFREVQLNLAGRLYIMFNAQGLPPLCSSQVEVSPATASQFEFSLSSSTLTSGIPVNLQVSGKDDFGNSDAPIVGSVELYCEENSIDSGEFPSPATSEHGQWHRVFLPKFEGWVTFGAKVNENELTPVNSIINPGAAHHLSFILGVPTWGIVGEPMTQDFQFEVLDQFGNRVITSSDSISLELSDGPEATLTGADPVTPNVGIATWNGISIDHEGVFTLKATSGSLGVATTTVTVYPPLQINPKYAVLRRSDLSESLNYTGKGGSNTYNYSLYGVSPGFSGATLGDNSGTLNFGSTLPFRGQLGVRVTDSITYRTSDSTVYSVTPQFNGAVRAMVVAGNFGYYAGDFTAYHPQLMNGVGKFLIDGTGLASGCNFAGLLGSGDQVWAMAYDPTSNALYLGGVLTSYAQIPVSNLIKLDLSTCARDSAFNPQFDGAITALALSGDDLFVGGNFSMNGTVEIPYLNHLNSKTGALDSTFSFPLDDQVNVLRLTSDALYVGGSFKGGFKRIKLNAEEEGALGPSIDDQFGTFDGEVHAIAGPEAGKIYVGGIFSTYTRLDSPSSAKNLVALYLNQSSETPASESPGMVALNFDVDFGTGALKALALVEGKLYVGGDFVSCNEKSVDHLVKLNVDTANLDMTFLSGSAPFQGPIETLSLFSNADSGTDLYVGGNLYADRIELASGNRTHFSALEGVGFNGPVHAILPVIDSTDPFMMVGGGFMTFGGEPAPHIAKVDLTTGDLNPVFSQNAAADERVSALAISSSGTALFMGGSFKHIGTGSGIQSANYLAKVNLSDGSLDATFTRGENSEPSGLDGPVYALAVSSAGVYAGGSFTKYTDTSQQVVNSGHLNAPYSREMVIQPLSSLVKLDEVSGVLDTSFSFTTANQVSIYALALSNSDLYVGGDLNHGLAKISAANGLDDTAFFVGGVGFKKGGDPGTVYALSVASDGLFVGGDFTSLEAPSGSTMQGLNGLVKVNPISGQGLVTFGSSNRKVFSLAVHESTSGFGNSQTVYAGYENLNNAALGGVSAFNGASGGAPIFTKITNGPVQGVVPVFNRNPPRLYLGGKFMRYGVLTELLNTVGNSVIVNPSTGAAFGF